MIRYKDTRKVEEEKIGETTLWIAINGIFTDRRREGPDDNFGNYRIVSVGGVRD